MRRYKNVQKAYVCCPIAYHGFSVTTIAMPTLADDGENVYEEIYGKAQWDASPDDVFSDGYDQMAISWGGNQAFKARTQRCGGWYYDGSNFTGARNKSDIFTGYCWQFQEHNGFGWIESMQANVSLERMSGTVSGKETNAVLSYVHTYGEIVPSVNFNVGSSGINGGISLSTTVQNWKAEADLGGLMY